jgi:hypothetical protein
MKRFQHRIVLGLLILFEVAVGHLESETTARHEGVRVLSSGDFKVEVMDPAARHPYYQGNRFSPVANVLRATLHGHDFLFSPVIHDPAKENAGLAMEFDLKQWPNGGPPGFSEALEGELFLKVGVGCLRKTGDDYAFYKPYKTERSAQTHANWKSDQASFQQTCQGISGYGYLLDASVIVRKQTLEIDYRLKNTGSKAFATEQYAHNFFCFDNLPVGPDYELEVSSDFVMTQGERLQREGHRLRLPPFVDHKMAINATLTLESKPSSAETIVVWNSEKKMRVAASVSSPTSRVALHITSRYLCPEQFVQLKLNPGETAAWSRRYQFEAEDSTSLTPTARLREPGSKLAETQTDLN